MRTTKDLIDELWDVAADCFLTAIVVAFDHETKFVFHEVSQYGAARSKEEALEELNDHVKAGGIPMGLVGYYKKGTAFREGTIVIPSRRSEGFILAYPEHKGEARTEAAEFLKRLLRSMDRTFREHQVGKVDFIVPEEN